MMSEESLPATAEPKQPTLADLDMTDPRDQATVMVKSGYFKDATAISQALVKIMAGRELGLGAFAAMQAFDIVEGNLRTTTGQLAAWTKAHPLRDYRVRESTTKGCRIEWFQRDSTESEWESIGSNEWTDEDRERAGLSLKTFRGKPSVWAKYPTAMMFNRAFSNGVAMFVPDIIPTGNRVYSEGDDFGPRDEGYAARVPGGMEDSAGNIEVVPNGAETTSTDDNEGKDD